MPSEQTVALPELSPAQRAPMRRLELDLDSLVVQSFETRDRST
jgi:hypothetical protein